MKLIISIRKLAHSNKIINFSESNLLRRLRYNNKNLNLTLNEVTIYQR